MSKKATILYHLNMRAISRAVYSILCRYQPLREYLNYYREAESIEIVADRESLRTITIVPARDYGISHTAEEQQDPMGRDDGVLFEDMPSQGA